VLVRVDPSVPGDMFRGAIISAREIALLRSIEDVVRLGKVRRITRDQLVMEGGEVPSRPGDLYVDCTARGVPMTPWHTVFDGSTVTLSYVTIGLTPYSAATVAAVESLCAGSDEEKNALCPPLAWSGRTQDVLDLAYAGMAGLAARQGVPELAAWTERCRLNPGSGAIAKAGEEPEIAAALTSIITDIGPAMANLQARAGRGEAAVHA
jgi:hypothetical protein